MVKQKAQRVAVFVDVQNMYYSAKQLYNSKVNFHKILSNAVGGRQLVRAMAYAISADIQGENKFQDALTKIGYEVRLKDLQTFIGGAKKGDWDVGIAMDIVRITPKVDVIVLISGDGDFQDLLEYVKAQGCRAEVMGFGKTSSSRIKKAADSFVDLGKDYLIYDKQYETKLIKKQLEKNNRQVQEVKNDDIKQPAKKIVKKTIIKEPKEEVKKIVKKSRLIDKIKKAVKKKK